MAASILLGISGTAGAVGGTSNGPTFGGKATSDGTLAILWTPDAYELFSNYQLVDDGGLLFGTTLTASAYNPHGSAEVLNLTAEQFTVGHETIQVGRQIGNATVAVNETVAVRENPVWRNTTFTVPPLTVASASVNLPATPAGTTLNVAASVGVADEANDSPASWGFDHLTPNYLFPYPTTTGGVLAAMLGEGMLAVLLSGIAVVAARRTMRTPGIGSPKISLVVSIGALGGGAIAWYVAAPISFLQFVGGSSPYAFPGVWAFLFYLWTLRHFDDSEIVEIERTNYTVPLTVDKLWLRFDRRRGDKTYLVRRNFRGFAFPLLGFPTEIDMRPVNDLGDEGPVAGVPLTETRLMNRREHRRAARAVEYLRAIGIAPPKAVADGVRGWTVHTDDPDGPSVKYRLDSDRTYTWRPARLLWWEEYEREQPAKEAGAAPVKVKKRRFRPHVEPSVFRAPLSGEHARTMEALALDGKAREHLSRALEVTHLQVLRLDRKLDQEAGRIAEEQTRNLMAQLAEETAPFDEADAAKELEELKRRAPGGKRGSLSKSATEPTEADTGGDEP